MSQATQDTAIRTGRITRTLIYLVLLLFALFYLLPLYVMAGELGETAGTRSPAAA